MVSITPRGLALENTTNIDQALTSNVNDTTMLHEMESNSFSEDEPDKPIVNSEVLTDVASHDSSPGSEISAEIRSDVLQERKRSASPEAGVIVNPKLSSSVSENTGTDERAASLENECRGSPAASDTVHNVAHEAEKETEPSESSEVVNQMSNQIEPDVPPDVGSIGSVVPMDIDPTEAATTVPDGECNLSLEGRPNNIEPISSPEARPQVSVETDQNKSAESRPQVSMETDQNKPTESRPQVSMETDHNKSPEPGAQASRQNGNAVSLEAGSKALTGPMTSTPHLSSLLSNGISRIFNPAMSEPINLDSSSDDFFIADNANMNVGSPVTPINVPPKKTRKSTGPRLYGLGKYQVMMPY